MSDNVKITGGVLKHWFTDFIVNEIDEDGNVVFLSTVNGIVDEPLILNEEKKEEVLEGALVPINESLLEIIKSKLSDLNAELLINFIKGINEKIWEKSEMCTLTYISEKEKWKEVHQMIKEHFPTLETHSIQENGESLI